MPMKKPGKSRWDTSSDGTSIPHTQLMPTPAMMMPDFSRPPPGFGPPGGPPGPGPGHPIAGQLPPPVMHQQKQQPFYEEASLVPSMPYYDSPAGLMVYLVKMEDSGYKPLDPKKLRLPPPTPPSERLLAALEQFYAPPSHERPRDPDGWEMLGLYEWSKDKTAAIKQKADDIEAGNRERSPTASPDDRFARDSSPEDGERNGSNRSSRSSSRKEEPERRRKRYREKSRSRSRSRTRSRSRESTPDQKRAAVSRSPSPAGGYSMPSYLTKRSPSPDRARSPPPARGSRASRLSRRSPSPEHQRMGFGSATSMNKQIDSSNKGHQMMQKMGWRGSGLGSGESGIVEPISGGEVRDKNDQFRGVGHGSDPFEAFRKSKAGSFYTRMKDRDRERDKKSSKD